MRVANLDDPSRLEERTVREKKRHKNTGEKRMKNEEKEPRKSKEKESLSETA